MNDLEESKYKKLAKRELKVFLVFFIGLIISVSTLFAVNGINLLRWHSLTNNIDNAEIQIAANINKNNVRNEFWVESTNTFDLKEYDNNIEKYWEFLVKSKEGPFWLNYYYTQLKNNPYNNIAKFGIASPSDLKLFIENNIFTDEDIKKEEFNKVLNNDIELDKNKKNNLTFFEIPDIRMISIISLAVLFGLFYVLRPLILFIYTMFREAS